MMPRTLLSNPLLLKELASQARRPGKPGWAYPGPIWFLVVTVVPAIVYLRTEQGPDTQARTFYLVAAMFQLWLLAFRSTLYTATSMATDVRQGTLPVLLSTPMSLAGSLRAKMTACLLPLWLEILASVPASMLAYGWYGSNPVPPEVILGVAGFLGCSSILFGGLGLWLGGLLADPERAARASRLLVGVLLLATALGPQQNVHGVIVLVGILLWVCLVWLPQVRPHQAVQGSIAALLVLLVLPVIFATFKEPIASLNLSVANPLFAVYEFRPANPKDPGDQALLAGDADLARGLGLEFPRVEDQGPTEAEIRDTIAAADPARIYGAIKDSTLLTNRLEVLHTARAMGGLVPLGLVYLLGGLGLVQMALGRARSAC